MSTRIRMIVLGSLLAVGCAACPVSAAAVADPGVSRTATATATGAEGVPRLGNVFLIIGENKTYSHLTTTNAPFLMGTVRQKGAWLSNYYAATHWSQANYVALVTGQFTRCEQQDVGTACHQNIDNLYHQMDVAGLSWKVWLGAGTAKSDTGSGGSRARKTAGPLAGFLTTGNPPTLFQHIAGTSGVWST